MTRSRWIVSLLTALLFQAGVAAAMDDGSETVRVTVAWQQGGQQRKAALNLGKDRIVRGGPGGAASLTVSAQSADSGGSPSSFELAVTTPGGEQQTRTGSLPEVFLQAEAGTYAVAIDGKAWANIQVVPYVQIDRPEPLASASQTKGPVQVASGVKSAPPLQMPKASGDPGTRRWKTTIDDTITLSTPALSGDGILYVGANDGKVYGLNSSNGSQVYEIELDGPIIAAPTIGPDGTVYVGTIRSTFYALDPEDTEEPIWSYDLDTGSVAASAAVDLEGNVYVPTDGGTLHGFPAGYPAEGSPWTYTQPNGALRSAPAILGDGTIYVGSNDGRLYALDKDGTHFWEYNAQSPIRAAPAVGIDGTAFFGTADGEFYAIGASGSPLWEVSTSAGHGISGSAVIGSDRKIHFCDDGMEGNLYALRPDGESDWSISATAAFVGSPALDEDGTLYLAVDDGHIDAIDRDLDVLWSYDAEAIPVTGPMIGSDGTVYAVCDDGTVHAIHSAADGTEDVLWPMQQHDSRRSGLNLDTSLTPTVRLTAADDHAYETGLESGGFTVTLDPANTRDIEVEYSVSGSATNRVDYMKLADSVTVPAGQTQVTIPVVPLPDTEEESIETIDMSLEASDAYNLHGSLTSARVLLHDAGEFASEEVKSTGDNLYGQLGDGTTTERRSPVTVEAFNQSEDSAEPSARVRTVAAGTIHSLAVTDDGGVWAWGRNAHGQLGDGTTEDRTEPIQVPGLEGALAVAGGARHSMVLLADGTVNTWGHNIRGQLGYEDTTSDEYIHTEPAPIPGLENVGAIAAGAVHSLALLKDGTVMAWGFNAFHQLGYENETPHHYVNPTPSEVPGLQNVQAIAAGGHNSYALLGDGTVMVWGANAGNAGPTPVTGLYNVKAISATRGALIALRDDGSPVTLGDFHAMNASTDPLAGLTDIRAIATGDEHAFAIHQDGTVFGAGRNYSGQIGDGTDTRHWQAKEIEDLDGARIIAAGQRHTLALAGTTGGGVKTDDEFEENDTFALSKAVQDKQYAGLICRDRDYYKITVRPQQTLSVNIHFEHERGDLGLTLYDSDENVLTTSETEEDIEAVSYTVASQQDIFILVSPQFGSKTPYSMLVSITGGHDPDAADDTLEENDTRSEAVELEPEFLPGLICADSDYYRIALNNGQHSAESQGERLAVRLTSVPADPDEGGELDRLALRLYDSSGEVLEELNDDVPVKRLSYDAVDAETVYVAVVPLDEDGELLKEVDIPWAYGLEVSIEPEQRTGVVAWGDNRFGQFADGTTIDHVDPKAVPDLVGVQALATGRAHVLALMEDGTVYAWGDNNYGQVGNGSVEPQLESVMVPDLANVVAVAAGQDHSLALLEDGTVKAWGRNDDHQLGDGTTQSRTSPEEIPGLSDVIAIAAGAHHALALLSDSTLMAWGRNGDGQLGDRSSPYQTHGGPVQVLQQGPGPLTGIHAISAGESHSLALHADGTIYGWGANSDGQLGSTAFSSTSTPRGISIQAEPEAILGWGNQSGMIVNDGTLRTWGWNHFGQLGDGQTSTASAPKLVGGFGNVIGFNGGRIHTLAVESDGAVWSWGWNHYGQLGHGEPGTDQPIPGIVEGIEATAVAACERTSFALKLLPDDAYEPNDEEHQAPELEPDLYEDLISQDDDHYRVQVPQNRVLRVTVEAPGTDGEMQVALYSPENDLLDSKAGMPLSTTLESPLSQDGGSYRISVLTDASQNVEYSLTVELIGGEDEYEENDTRLTAASLGGGTHENLWCADEDWYAVPLEIGEYVDASIAIMDFHADLSLFIYSENGILLDESQTGGTNESVQHDPVEEPRTVYLRVARAEEGVNLYDLTITKVDTEDEYENNDAPATATPLDPGTYQDLKFTDKDYYAIDLAVEQSLSARIDFTHALGDLNLQILDESHQILAQSATTSDFETVSTEQLASAQTLYVVVYGSGDATNDYALKITTGGDDAYENNDTLSSASAIQAGAHPGLFCDDDDYFAVELPAGKMLTASATFDNAAGDLNMEVRDPSEALLDSSAGLDDVERVYAAASETTTVYVRVYPYGGAENDYDLDLEISPSGEDTYEENDTRAQAPVLTQDSYLDLYRWDDDYYAVDLEAADRIHAAIGFQPENGDLDLTLLDQTGTTLDTGAGPPGCEDVSYTTVSDRRVYLRVDAAFGTHNAYGLTFSIARGAGGTRLYTWGSNASGQLGIGNTKDRDEPVRAHEMYFVEEAAGGRDHTLALMADGTVHAWGSNASGQLGDGTTTTRTQPNAVPGLSDVAEITAGAYHSLALLKDGRVMAWGANGGGRLGDGTIVNKTSPVEVPEMEGATDVAAGLTHSMALLQDGTVMAWGYNGYGQLGDGTVETRYTPVAVEGITNATAISAGKYHSAALLADGTVLAWGRNRYGQLGNGSATDRTEPTPVFNLTDASSVACGDDHCLAVLADGRVMAWGRNHHGQLGNATSGYRSTPTEVQGLPESITAVAAGTMHSMALAADGSVYSWGYKETYGHLGNGTLSGTFQPVELTSLGEAQGLGCGGYHSLVIEKP